MEQAPLPRTDDPDLDSLFDEFDENPSEHENPGEYRVAPYTLRHSAPVDLDSEQPVPLFLSDSDGEPDPEEYITPRIKTRRASISSKILAVVCAASAAAIL